MKTRGAFVSRWVTVLFSVLSISVLSFYSESAAQPIELKLGFVTAASEGDPYFITSKKFGELVEGYTKGKYKVKLFPSGQLGNESEMIKNLTMGSMDLGVITNAPTGAFVKSFMVFDLPFIFPNEQVAHKVLDGEAGKMVLAKLDKLQIVGLAISEGGFRHMINNVRPVNTPEDTKGIKFRVMTTPIYIALFQSLGSNAVPLPWGEVFTAMQQKVVDGLEIPLSVIYANKFYEVAKYLSLTNHTYSPLILMCSEQRWKKFSSEEKEIFKRSAYEATVYARNEAKGINEDILKKLKAAGMVINDVSNKKPFQDAVRPMYKQFEEEIGKEVLQAVLNASDAASK
ncbi:MAG: TRAP transporter substrate-binding protein [Desulfobacterales bacterium]|jgi:TRAP-type transport system periplasmic protein|nr:TRAP transporter substrate-binding protein [Desulfobacterales bacterium]